MSLFSGPSPAEDDGALGDGSEGPPATVARSVADMVEARNWGQFHTPENLAKSIVIEAAELLECFQWGPEAPMERVVSELADVVTYCHLLAGRLGVALDDVVLDKLVETRQKYPVDLARGRSTKYDRL